MDIYARTSAIDRIQFWYEYVQWNGIRFTTYINSKRIPHCYNYSKFYVQYEIPQIWICVCEMCLLFENIFPLFAQRATACHANILFFIKTDCAASATLKYRIPCTRIEPMVGAFNATKIKSTFTGKANLPKEQLILFWLKFFNVKI